MNMVLGRAAFGQYRGELSANYSARRTGAGYEGATIESVVPAVRRAARNGQAMGAHQVGFSRQPRHTDRSY